MDLDRRILRAAGSAEEQDVAALSEDEEVGDQVLEPWAWTGVPRSVSARQHHSERMAHTRLSSCEDAISV